MRSLHRGGGGEADEPPPCPVCLGDSPAAEIRAREGSVCHSGGPGVTRDNGRRPILRPSRRGGNPAGRSATAGVPGAARGRSTQSTVAAIKSTTADIPLFKLPPARLTRAGGVAGRRGGVLEEPLELGAEVGSLALEGGRAGVVLQGTTLGSVSSSAILVACACGCTDLAIDGADLLRVGCDQPPPGGGELGQDAREPLRLIVVFPQFGVGL